MLALPAQAAADLGNRAPVCDNVAVSFTAGSSAKVPFARCTDADGDRFQVVILTEPAHGTFDFATQTYTPEAGFSGEDLMAFRAMDERRAQSAPGSIRITVTPASLPGPEPEPGTPPPSDATAPVLALSAPSRMGLRAALRRGLRTTATTDEPGSVSVRVLVARTTARRLGLATARPGAVAVASLKREIAAGETVLTLKLSRQARRRLKRAAAVDVRIVATIADTAGNTRTTTLRVKLK